MAEPNRPDTVVEVDGTVLEGPVIGRHAWREPFLDTLRQTGNVAQSCRASRIARSAAYEQRANDPEFGARWDEALEEATDALELIAYNRAMSGQSDRMLIFMLRQLRPEKWNQTPDMILNGGATTPLEIEVNIMELPALTARH